MTLASPLLSGDGPWIATKQQGAAIALESGVPQAFSLPAVDTATLYLAPPGAFSIEVPEGASSLTVSVQADHETYLDADIDLFVSVGAQPSPNGEGGVDSDYRSMSVIASEMLTIDSRSDPPLRAGRYFISLSQTIVGQPAGGSVSALIRLDDLPPAANLPAPDGMNVITTIAGASQLFEGGGEPAVGASLSNGLSDVAVSPAGEVHFVDSLNAMVMKVRGNGSGVGGGIGGDALRAGLAPSGIAFSPLGELFIAGFYGRVYRIDDGKLVVYADLREGNAVASGRKLAFDRVGNLYVSEETMNRVLMVTPDGTSTVAVGTGDKGFGGDGGPANGAQLSAPAPPSPGALVSIFGVRLSQGTAGITELPLPQELAGTSVFIGGIPAPLLFSSTGQVNALIPNELRPNTSHRVIIQRGTTLTEAVDISVAAAQPAVFRTSPAGRQGHIYRAVNGAQILAEPATAAQAGEAVIIYSAGLGAVDPARVTIEGVDAPVFFSGLSPGFVGLYQVNAFVPEGLGRNDAASLVMEVGGARSPAVTIAVR